MLVKEVIGGVLFAMLWLGIAMFGIAFYGNTDASASTVNSEVVCGVDTADYGSGVVECDGSITSWAVDASSYVKRTDDYILTRHTTSAGFVSEVVVDRANGSVSAYVG